MTRTSRIMALACVLACLVLRPAPLMAAEDPDQDGLTDVWEAVFQTNPGRADTDGDGFSDGEEIRQGFDPRQSGGIRLKDTDVDEDGLSDRFELLFETDPRAKDTDADGYLDGQEIAQGYDPRASNGKALAKRVLVDLSEQKLFQELGGVVIASHVVSSGKASTPTPVGAFTILNKHQRAWSRSAKLWMPYWMAFRADGYGFHELPEWPGGKKEGKAHLGTPVSHGCVRIGEGVAKTLYDWTPVGTKVVIQR